MKERSVRGVLPGVDLRQTYRRAKELEAAAQRALGAGHPFVQWLLLAAIAELTKEREEDVSQALIATRTGLSRKVVCHWMNLLNEQGLVDRGEHRDGRCWSVLLNREGTEALQYCNERLEAAGLTG